ncbi:hypothetical protein BDZ94DRAFT_1265838 [Collybia nuda]|uniref:Uncharacterized protein n=1 Tax=Collybia nuda TaxID=64659 RepID=A0A9P6CCE5_9AGAR|nr:hypothetical protein BDZ94DRAFT_1265838 [Collybia nuda]
MVAARKVPVAPAPASRSNSTQALPRRPPKQKSTPLSPQKKKDKPPSAVSQRLFIFLLSIFAVYAATVCRSDSAFSSPVCRGLATYRNHILEPYIVPPIRTYLVAPIQSAVHHPALAPLHPYAHSASAAVRPRVSAAASAVKARYDAHVVPAATTFWENKVLPTYKTHVYPRARPYIFIYQTRVQPVYDSAYTRVESYVESAKPHVHATYVITRKYSIAAYAAAKPRALALYARVRPHAIVFYHQTKVYGATFLAKAVEARRQFVDPHVRRIWDKVGEAEATGAMSTSRTIVPEAEPTLIQEEPVSASSVIQASVAAESGIAADVASAAAEAASSSSAAASASLAAASSSAAASLSSASVAASASLASASSAAASSSAEAAVSPAQPKETPPPEEATQTSSSTVTSTESETAASVASIIAASLHVPVANAQEPIGTTTTDDATEIDDFLRDIGLDDTPPSDPSNTEAEAEVQEPNTGEREREPTEEERLAVTAQRRADIVGRHQNWQTRLATLITEREGAFGGVLDGFRGGAVKELAEMFPKEGGVVGSVEAEAGRLVKGLEGYVQKLKAKAELDEEERGKWGKVLAKVEERFAEKVRNVQGEVHEWYMGVREGEGREVRRVAAEVKSLAEKAQADIGLDYAWLDDVTYQDWQKYHDLMRASERFATTLESIQNGTHPNAQRDVLVGALDTLEAEMQEVISGFLVRLQAIQREAQEGVFSPVQPQPPAAEPVDDVPSSPSTPSGEEEPRVSILPIEPEPQVKAAEGMEHLFVGKDAEAVKKALEGVEVEPEVRSASDHVEL